MTPSNTSAPLFNEARLNRHRALSPSFPNPTGLVLQKKIEEDLVRMVQDLRLPSSRIRRLLIWGSRLDFLPQALNTLFPGAEIMLADTTPMLLEKRVFKGHLFSHEKDISLDTGSLDLAISCLSLQTLNAPLTVLQNYHRLLSSGGVFIASFLGGSSLQYLHQALLTLELSLKAGAHQRVIPMIDLSTALSLLQHASFQGCVADHDALSFSFKTLKDFRHFLKTLGLQSPLTTMPHTSKEFYHTLQRAQNLTQSLIFDVISLVGWKEVPHFPRLDVPCVKMDLKQDPYPQ